METLNKNYKVFTTPLGNVVIPIIKQPYYFIQGFALTEYDVRNIQLEVASGNISHEVANALKITDENNEAFNFREDGILINSPKGYRIISEMALKLLCPNKNK